MLTLTGNARTKNTSFLLLLLFLLLFFLFFSRLRSLSSFPSSRFHLQLAFGQWVGIKNRGNGMEVAPFLSLFLSLSLYPDTSKASSKLGKRRVIKSAFQHLIIARRNLISNPFCAALFTARFPSLQMYWFFQIRSNLPSIAERTRNGIRIEEKRKRRIETRALVTRLIIFSSRERRKASLPFRSSRAIVARLRIGQDPRADPLSNRIESSLHEVTFVRQPISLLFPPR